MSIWKYGKNKRLIANWLDVSFCPFCKELLTKLEYDQDVNESELGWKSESSLSIDVCNLCGWWKTKKEQALVGPQKLPKILEGTWGLVSVLKNLNLFDLSLPLNEIRSFLIAKYEKRFNLHPRLFEETVASVFKDLGFNIVVTGFTRDGGIDIILSNNYKTIGVQVKCTKNTIYIDQIRDLIGALVIDHKTKGVFVTTSDFSKGVKETIKKLNNDSGIKIELISSNEFYEALRITQRDIYKSIEDFLSCNEISDLELIRSFEGV